MDQQRRRSSEVTDGKGARLSRRAFKQLLLREQSIRAVVRSLQDAECSSGATALGASVSAACERLASQAGDSYELSSESAFSGLASDHDESPHEVERGRLAASEKGHSGASFDSAVGQALDHSLQKSLVSQGT